MLFQNAKLQKSAHAGRRRLHESADSSCVAGAEAMSWGRCIICGACTCGAVEHAWWCAFAKHRQPCNKWWQTIKELRKR